MSDNRVYSYSAVLMGSPILLKLCSHDEAMASAFSSLSSATKTCLPLTAPSRR